MAKFKNFDIAYNFADGWNKYILFPYAICFNRRTSWGKYICATAVCVNAGVGRNIRQGKTLGVREGRFIWVIMIQ